MTLDKEDFHKKLLVLQALAEDLLITTKVTLTETGLSVKFYGNHEIETTITTESDEWEVASFEKELKSLKVEIDLKIARRVRAQEIFSRLSDEDKLAVKENIKFLK